MELLLQQEEPTKTDDPGDDDTMNSEDKDNPHTDDDPLISNKVNLDGSFTSVTKAPLKEPTDEVMNTTMDKDSLGTLLMDDPGGDNTMDNKVHIAGPWLTGMDGALRSYVQDCGG